MKKLIKATRKFIRRLVVFFIVSTILAVVAGRFLPIMVTPLMIIRCVEQKEAGQPLTLHHRWVPLAKMPTHMPVAVMASEDQLFLEHHGFDFKAIQKAAERNHEGKKTFGASTISQQTAKNVFLWPGRSWLRKGLEAYFTVLIELIWGKERIMEVYLNSIEMGPGIYGIGAVAEYHFDKRPADLSRADCALIAATLPNPRRYSSLHPTGYMYRRQHWIERQMRNIPPFKMKSEK